jgi:serine/threonine-protein kinase TNNI3K
MQHNHVEVMKQLGTLVQAMTIQEVQQSIRITKEKVKNQPKDLSGVTVSETHVTKGQILGKGGYGVVYSGTYKGAPVAVKELLLARLEEASNEEFLNEVLIMR